MMRNKKYTTRTQPRRGEQKQWAGARKGSHDEERKNAQPERGGAEARRIQEKGKARTSTVANAKNAQPEQRRTEERSSNFKNTEAQRREAAGGPKKKVARMKNAKISPPEHGSQEARISKEKGQEKAATIQKNATRTRKNRGEQPQQWPGGKWPG